MMIRLKFSACAAGNKIFKKKKRKGIEIEIVRDGWERDGQKFYEVHLMFPREKERGEKKARQEREEYI